VNRKPLYSPLELTPGPSYRLTIYLLLGHCVAAMLLLSVPVPPWLKMGLAVMIVGSLHWSYRMQVTRSAGAAIVRAAWDAQGTWELTIRSGECLQARLLPDSFVSSPLVVLNFQLGPRRRRSLVLTPDNTDQQLLRRLRVRLRLQSAAEQGQDSQIRGM
jgi:hypothetical protein